MQDIPRYQAPGEGRLSASMLDDYREAGVLVLESFVAVERCRQLRERILELVAAFDPAEDGHIFSAMQQTQLDDAYFEESGDKIRFFFEHDAFDADGRLRQPREASLNKMGHAMHDLDPVFDAFSRTPELARLAADLGLEDPGVIQSMVIFKPPRIGGEVCCHQDSTFIYTEPESCVGFWFALEDATVDNGCMRFIPGGHRLGLKQRHYRNDQGRLVFETLDETPWPADADIPAEAGTGTLVVFDGRSPHRSGPNRSDRSRMAYTLHAIDKACHYPDSNWLKRRPDLPLRGFAG